MGRDVASARAAAAVVGLVRIAIGGALLSVGRHGGIGLIALAVGGILVALGLIRLWKGEAAA
jgi:hypothetical protein